MFKGKKVLVVGFARSGISAALVLIANGARVTISDSKKREDLDLKDFEERGIKFYLGKNPDDIILDFDLVVMSPGVPCDLSFVIKAEENEIPVWSEIELAYKLCKAPIIAITGTNGKTTTTALLGEIAKSFNPLSEIVGNIGIPFAEKASDIDKNALVIAELSSFQLEKIVDFKPIISAVLNITPDHLNRHKTLENYILAKERVFENQTEKEFLVLNYNDEVCKKMSKNTKAKTVFFSRDIEIKEGLYSDKNSIYVKIFGYDEKIVDINELSILGGHNVENAMAAAAMALCANIPLEIIRKALISFKAVEHRIEFVAEINGVEYYNDSKGTNPDAAIKAVQAMKKPIFLIGGGYDKGSDFTEWIKSFKDKVKYMAIIGEVKDNLSDTAEKLGFRNYEKVDTLEDAVKKCMEKAEKGDCVLLSPACASWDMFESYEQRGNMFKEFVLRAGE